MIKIKLPLGLLLVSGLFFYGCGSDSKNDDDDNTAGNGGSSAGGSTGGGGSSTGGGGSSSTAGGGSGGETAGGGSGGDGAVGVLPVDGMCPRRSTLRTDGLCYCQPTSLTMCTDACANTDTDPDYCGDCDTACEATQPCIQGQCGATPAIAVPAASGCGSIRLALGGGVLYWTETTPGTVKSLAAAGGTPMTVATAQNAPTLIQTQGTTLYWLNSGDNTIMKAPLAGGAPETVVTSVTAIGGFTLSADGNTLYFSTEKTVNSVSTSGGAVTEIGHEDVGLPKALAVAGDLVAYPADNTGDVDVMTITPGTPAVCASEDSQTATNSNCERLAQSQGNLNFESVYLIDGTAYWANQAAVLAGSATNPTGINDTIASGSANAFALLAFAIQGDTVYFADNADMVFKAPLLPDSDETPIARAQVGVTSLVADDANVYWATGDCAIMSLPAD